MRAKILKWSFIIFIVVPILGVSIWTWVSLNYVYSSGQRAGFLQKFSKRGWLFKTWEGELAMVNLPGAMPEIFYFSARKEDVANNIEHSLGKRVVLSYDEHRGIPTNVFAETRYFATNVKPVEETPAAPSATR